MIDNVCALLVHNRSVHVTQLVLVLEALGIQCREAATSSAVREELNGVQVPQVVFTDTYYADGDWKDVVHLAQGARQATNVIVVSRLEDVRLYLDTIDFGAFDFITPPYRESDVSHLMHCVARNAAGRRRDQGRMLPRPATAAAAAPRLECA
jgi:DNA-binding NtrC family response regulator